MYETYYRLKKRPFAAVPDAELLVQLPAIIEVLERLDRCIRQGRGIAVLIAEAGYGKTQICHSLSHAWEADYCVAMLPNASFPTRRGLLQAILAELDEPYERLGETELRLKLNAIARSVRTQKAGIVLILDEAHRYTDRLLEEVRLISNLIEDGEPLIRVLLAGQLALEDSLANPDQAGLNERIGEMVTLPRMTIDESLQYLGDRVHQMGGDLSQLFESSALNTLVRACGGIPRCLNQLADHSLLLGYVAECKPVKEHLVLEALDDLKRLPLQWQDPPRSRANPIDESSTFQAWETTGTPDSAENVVEIGCLDDESGDAFAHPVEENLESWQDSEPTQTLGADSYPKPSNSKVIAPTVERPASEQVHDRFAQIDASHAQQRWLEEIERKNQGSQTNTTAVGAGLESGLRSKCTSPLQTLDRIEPLLQAVIDDDAPVRSDESPRFAHRGDLEQIVAALEKSNREAQSAGGSNRSVETGQSTLFRDLRRRDRKPETGQT